MGTMMLLTATEGTNGISEVTNSLVKAVTSGANDIMGAIGDIVEPAFPVIIAVIVITVGIKVFRKVTGR